MTCLAIYVSPLERLMPFSRDWLEGGNDMTVDVMMFFSNAFWNGFAKYLIQVLFLVSLVEALEPYGHELATSQQLIRLSFYHNCDRTQQNQLKDRFGLDRLRLKYRFKTGV